MTRNTYEGPSGNDGQYGYPSQPPYSHQQGYGDYSSNNGQSYGYQQNSGSSQSGYSDQQGTAQSYYGTNDQAYQQYPQDRPHEQHPYDYQSRHQPVPGQYDQQQYGRPPPQAQDYPPYGQPPQHEYHSFEHQSNQVNDFRPQFDQPHVQPSASGHYGQPPLPSGSEQDRGLMGALAGGAAGAYGGHKINHGFLGTIGGAIAGSMLEDTYKKKSKKDKKHKKPRSRRGSSSSSSSSSSSDSDRDQRKKKSGTSVPAGNFHASSRNVYLEGNATLVAECADVHGLHQRTTIDLNDALTNTNGRMHWARGGNFAGSARHIRLADNGNCLEAELGDGQGGWNYNKIDLNERITNNNGRLELL